MSKKRQYVILFSLIVCGLSGIAALAGFLLFLLYMPPDAAPNFVFDVRFFSFLGGILAGLFFLASAAVALIALLAS